MKNVCLTDDLQFIFTKSNLSYSPFQFRKYSTYVSAVGSLQKNQCFLFHLRGSKRGEMQHQIDLCMQFK